VKKKIVVRGRGPTEINRARARPERDHCIKKRENLSNRKEGFFN